MTTEENELGTVALDAGLSETARFLAMRPPFDGLAPEELGEVVAHTQIEFYEAGAVILSEDGGPVTFLRVIESGAVDIAHAGRLLDLLGPGDTFGHAAMLSGLPPGFEARAAEDTLCYRIPVAVARPILDRARSRELAVGVHEPGHQAVVELIRSPTVRCEPAESIGEIARRMTDAGASSAVIDLPHGGLGIVTDRDLRTRVLAADLSSAAPVRQVMSSPVFTVTPDRIGGEVLFEMLERGIRHTPIVSERGELIGVVEDADLFAVQPRSWFGVRRAIARAQEIASLSAVAGRLPEIVRDLHASNLRALEVARVLSALIDAITVRALDLADTTGTLPPDGLVWVAVGSLARRELTPTSTARGAIVCSQPPPRSWIESAGAALTACGLGGEIAARRPDDWSRSGVDDELGVSVLLDRRALWGTPREPLPVPEDELRARIVDALAERALLVSPPTGFDSYGVLESDGTRNQRLDIRTAAVAPIVAIARWASAAAKIAEGSTIERLRGGARAGVLDDSDARTLIDAFELAIELRIARHMEQLTDGLPPDDRLVPATMSTLARDHLRDVFRAIAAVQRRLRG